MAITMTETAKAEIRRLLQENEHPPEGGLRLFVKGGGCAGMSYGMEVVSESTAQDKTFEDEDVKVFIDPKSYLFLQGIIVDFKESLMGRGFVFENPNASGACGCGTSFSV